MSYQKEYQQLENFYHVLKSPVISITAPAVVNSTHLLFTWRKPGRIFLPVKLSMVLVDKAGNSFTSSPSACVGSVTNLDDWVANGTSTLDFLNDVSSVNTIGQVNLLPLKNFSSSTNAVVPLRNNVSVYLKITSTGSGGSLHKVVFFTEGFVLEF